ncbi:MAG: NfeD family protein [candidate division SR1 bacterium]|nr:NfeD family protein [candidate division SR1 bacterium]
MTFFLICMLVGVILLLFSIFGGFGDHDFHFDHDAGADHGGDSDHDDGPSFFSFRVLVTFMTVFGAIGALCRNYELSMIISSGIGFIAGLIAGLLAWWLMKQTFKQQASSHIVDEDLIGKSAMVTTAIPAGGNPGEVSLEVKSQRKYFAAKTVDNTAVPLGTQVVVKEVTTSVLIVELKP